MVGKNKYGLEKWRADFSQRSRRKPWLRRARCVRKCADTKVTGHRTITTGRGLWSAGSLTRGAYEGWQIWVQIPFPSRWREWSKDSAGVHRVHKFQAGPVAREEIGL